MRRIAGGCGAGCSDGSRQDRQPDRFAATAADAARDSDVIIADARDPEGPAGAAPPGAVHLPLT
jgi:hypothetical protein